MNQSEQIPQKSKQIMPDTLYVISYLASPNWFPGFQMYNNTEKLCDGVCVLRFFFLGKISNITNNKSKGIDITSFDTYSK